MASNSKTKKARRKSELKPETSSLETAKENPAPEIVTPQSDAQTPAHDPDFARVVAESKQAIAEEGIKPVGKKRGRPPGSKNHTENPQNPQSNPQPSMAPSPAPSLAIHLKGPLMGLSTIPAGRYQIPELALTEEEAVACANSLDECIKAFIPDLNNMSPKTAAVLGTCLTVGSIGFNKYAIYTAKMSERRSIQAKTDASPTVTVPHETVTEPNMNVGQYFKSQRVDPGVTL